MGLPVLEVTMCFRQPQREPEILIDAEGRHIFYASHEDAFPTVIASAYRRNPDGTIDVRGNYDPQDLAERMSRMGYEVATRGLGNVIVGMDGVVGLTVPAYCVPGRARKIIGQINREVSLKGQSSL